MVRNRKYLIVPLLIVLVAVLALVGCFYIVYAFTLHNLQEVKNPKVTFDVEEYGKVTIELYPEYAPNTVVNFIKLAQKGYYNGKVVYGKDSISEYWGRTEEGTVDAPKLSTIDESVDPDSDDNYEYEIKGEFFANKFNKNTLPHGKGIVSMVRANYTSQISSLVDESYNSANSQFTIILSDDVKELNGMYAAFGKVVEGMDVVEKMYDLAIQTDENNETDNLLASDSSSSTIQKFAEFPIINSTTVETYGVDYGMPEVEKAFDYSSYLYQLMSRYYSE